MIGEDICAPDIMEYDCTAEIQQFLPKVDWCWHSQGWDGCPPEGQDAAELWCGVEVVIGDKEFAGSCDEVERKVKKHFGITDEMIEDFESGEFEDFDDEWVGEEWYDNICIEHHDGDCTEEAREEAGDEAHIDVCKYHSAWDLCQEQMVYDECHLIVNGKHYDGPCDSIEEQVRSDERVEGCPKEEAGSCLDLAREHGIGEWVVECWYSREYEACTGEENWCNAAILTRNGHWIDGTCEEVQQHAEEVQAKKKEKKQARKAAEKEAAKAEEGTEGTA